MSEIVERFRGMPPLMVSEAELQSILIPVTAGYPWGQGTIGDLYRMGALTPDSTIGNEKRIIFPHMLAKWLEDVLARQGRPLDGAARAYNSLQEMSR